MHMIAFFMQKDSENRMLDEYTFRNIENDLVHFKMS